MKIFPSLISSDLLNLEKTLKDMNSICAGYHIDIMDDHFVPNLTWGAAFVNAIVGATTLPLYIHLMVDDPIRWIVRLKIRPQDTFIFHVESISNTQQINGLIREIKNKGWKASIAINPKTDVALVFDYLKDVDQVLIMSVEPGFSGQKYMSEVESKVEMIVKMRDDRGLDFKISMDGGIGVNNIKKLEGMGVDSFAVASAIFSSDDPIRTLQKLNQLN